MWVNGDGCVCLRLPGSLGLLVVEPSTLACACGLAERNKVSHVLTLVVAITLCLLITIMLLPELSPLTQGIPQDIHRAIICHDWLGLHITNWLVSCSSLTSPREASVKEWSEAWAHLMGHSVLSDSKGEHSVTTGVKKDQISL